MGEIADMMLDGTLCEGCGVYVGQSRGYPRKCRDCQKDDHIAASSNAQKTNCPICNRRVKVIGLADHTRDAHGKK